MGDALTFNKVVNNRFLNVLPKIIRDKLSDGDVISITINLIATQKQKRSIEEFGQKGEERFGEEA